MTAKEMFMEMFDKMPKKARRLLVYNYAIYPMSLNVCWAEIRSDTKLGKQILDELGFNG